MNDPSRGVLFVATGPRYREETLVAVESILAAMPGLPICIFADWQHDFGGAPVELRPVANAKRAYIDKVRCLKHTPFERTLFLDTDVFMAEPVPELFELLDRFDFMAAHDVTRQHDTIEPVSPAFPEVNTGVVAYRRGEAMNAFLADLEQTYERVHAQVAGDQTVFRPCLLRSTLRTHILPPEYNCQARQIGFLNGPAKIIHARNINLPAAARRLNARPGKRVFWASVVGGFRLKHISYRALRAWTAMHLLLRKLKGQPIHSVKNRRGGEQAPASDSPPGRER